MKSVKKIRKAMFKRLDSRRFEHTEGVAYTAAALAMRYGESVESALIAGLLHDCAKYMDAPDLATYAAKHSIEASPVEKANPFLLHAKVGEYIARNRYDVVDELILSAIRYHTTGRPEMTLLEEIIFVADYIEPGRSSAPNLDEIRTLAFNDLDGAVGRITADTLEYLDQSPDAVDELTRKTYEYYKEHRGS